MKQQQAKKEEKKKEKEKKTQTRKNNTKPEQQSQEMTPFHFVCVCVCVFSLNRSLFASFYLFHLSRPFFWRSSVLRPPSLASSIFHRLLWAVASSTRLPTDASAANRSQSEKARGKLPQLPPFSRADEATLANHRAGAPPSLLPRNLFFFSIFNFYFTTFSYSTIATVEAVVIVPVVSSAPLIEDLGEIAPFYKEDQTSQARDRVERQRLLNMHVFILN